MRNTGPWWFIGIVSVVSVATGAALAYSVTVAAVVVAVIAIAVLLPRIGVLVALAGAAIPLSPVLTVAAGGVRVPLADGLAVLAILSFVAVKAHRELAQDPGRPLGSLLSRVKPGLWLLAPYAVVAVFATAAKGWSAGSFAEIVQRIGIVAIWLVFGALAYQAGLLRRLLTWYVAVCAVLALAWIATPGAAGVFGVQKNPSGGFLASAILILLLSKLPNSRRLPLVLLLTAGLIATGSRGSILGLAVAAALLVLFVRQWRRVILPLGLVCVASAGALMLLPQDVQDRLLSQNASGRYTENIRATFVDDAMYQFARNPGGVGVGNYQQRAEALQNIDTRDPHNVFVLALVEGGYPLLVAFVLLAAGSVIWMLRRRDSSLAVLAVTVQVSIFAHAWVDVYWVRGTPVLGWLLIGAATAAVNRVRHSGQPITGVPPGRVSSLRSARSG